jgi:hypothetical protein
MQQGEQIMKRMLMLFFFTALAANTNAQAQMVGDEDVHPLLSDNWNVGIGIFRPTKDFKLRVDGQLPGQEINLQEDAGVKDTESTSALGVHWRFGEKWSVAGQFWGVDSGGAWRLDEDFRWQDLTFKEGTSAEIGLDLTVYRLFIARELWTKPGHELGAGIGLHYLEIDAFLAGEVIIDELGATDFQSSSVDAGAPLPNIGAWYLYSWSPKWALAARFDWLSASVGDYSGGLVNAQMGVHYQLFQHVGLGLSWNYFELDLDLTANSFSGRMETEQSGPFFSLDVNW